MGNLTRTMRFYLSGWFKAQATADPQRNKSIDGQAIQKTQLIANAGHQAQSRHYCLSAPAYGSPRSSRSRGYSYRYIHMSLIYMLIVGS